MLRAAVGERVRTIPVGDVVMFEATDKCVTVPDEAGGALIRMRLRELAGCIEGVEFLQVHRVLLVNAGRIRSAVRDEAVDYWVNLAWYPRLVKASRAFSHLFRRRGPRRRQGLCRPRPALRRRGRALAATLGISAR